MYADGFITRQYRYENSHAIMGLSLQRKDEEHLYKLKNTLVFDGNINQYDAKSSFGIHPYSRLLIRSKQLTDDLIKQGCGMKKTFALTFPTYDIIPQNLMIHFIRGYFDGDGSMTHFYSYGKYLKMTVSFTGTKEMIDGIKSFFRKPDLKLIQRFPERKTNNYTLNFSGNIQCMNILNMMYENSSIYLDRKYEKYLEYKKLTGK